MNKKVSAMNYYAYRLLIRQNEVNHILLCRRLFHQYAVDMYAKIETERLNYIRVNQKKLIPCLHLCIMLTQFYIHDSFYFQFAHFYFS